MKKSVEQYRALCASEQSIPLFAKAWWLDAAAGIDNWDVALVESGGKVVAALPYIVKKRYGFTVLSQPALTPALGPWFQESARKPSVTLALQKDWMKELIDQLPRFDRYSQNWTSNVKNWLPFYWQKFSQTTRYTYVLQELKQEERLWQGLQPNIRGDIKKARDRFGLTVRADLKLEDFLCLNEKTFQRQGMALPYSRDFVQKLDDACVERDSRAIFIAEDGEGRRHAGVYIVWDGNSAYYLMGGGDPQLRNSGATSFCMWEAIRFAATVTDRFDFEGSMIEPVERFFRGFGAQQVPYFFVTKTPSRLLRGVSFVRELRAA